MAQRLGFEAPLGNRMGISAELCFTHIDNDVDPPFPLADTALTSTDWFKDVESTYGGSVSLGYLISDGFSIGTGVHVYQNSISEEGADEKTYESGFQVAGDAGFLVRNSDNSMIFDMHSVITTQKQYYLNTKAQEVYKDSFPIITEATFTSAFLNRHLFAVLKGLGDIYYQKRQGFVVRAIPALEYWPLSFLSLRGGYQFTYLNLDGGTATGHGFMAGTTVRLGKFDLDVNFTSRYQPAGVLPGYGRTENFLLIGISRSGNFKSLSR